MLVSLIIKNNQEVHGIIFLQILLPPTSLVVLATKEHKFPMMSSCIRTADEFLQKQDKTLLRHKGHTDFLTCKFSAFRKRETVRNYSKKTRNFELVRLKTASVQMEMTSPTASYPACAYTQPKFFTYSTSHFQGGALVQTIKSPKLTF